MKPSRNPPVIHEIKLKILEKLGREFPAGSRLPPGPELARRWGLGQSNTQRAIQQLAREGYLQSRPRQGTMVALDIQTRLRTAPRRGALTGRRVAIVTALAYPPPFIHLMVRAARQNLRRAGAEVQLVVCPGMRPYVLSKLADADAFILANPSSHTAPIHGELRNVVVISTASSMADTLSNEINLVTTNDEHGGELAGRAMRDAGCSSACFIGMRSPADPGSYDELSRRRLRGFEAGWGSPLPEAHQLTTTAYGDTSGARVLRQYLQLNPRPRGVFAASDELAYGFMLAAMGAGLELNRDYDLIGFDGQYLTPGQGHGYLFKSVAVPVEEMGRAAARIIKRRLVQPDTPAQRLILGCGIKTATPATALQETQI